MDFKLSSLVNEHNDGQFTVVPTVTYKNEKHGFIQIIRPWLTWIVTRPGNDEQFANLKMAQSK